MSEIYYLFLNLFGLISADVRAIFLFLPLFLMFEVPLIILTVIGILKWYWSNQPTELEHLPSISFIITCYSEGPSILQTIDTLVEQVYSAEIEILVVIDGAVQNKETYAAAMQAYHLYRNTPFRTVRVIPKWQRGGRVSTLNAGLSKANNEIVINVDGDTSFDNDVAWNMAKRFANSDVLASGGALRVRNWDTNLITRMQSLEYMMSMQAGKTGTSELGLLNNISGAFGAFRKTILKRVGGWDTHTAEDLDLTMRLKQYKRRYPHMKLAFTPHAVGHTDVPDTLKGYISQRLRWDGDLFFLYLRKHIKGLNPSLLGWPTFIYTFVYGVLQNVLIPLLVVLFTIYLFVVYPLKVAVVVILLLYCLYFTVVVIKFLIYLLLVSERKNADLRMLLWLFIYPFYAFLSRIVTAFAVSNEVLRRSHEESNMAPWWVIKKGKKF
ncbi:glycosyltransferase [Psychromonas sp.]|uniref:glycosyltransferase family 2 protein n=1 Tax=Psychromonas sp. TaxID=1884585 RepID=UPI003562EF25